MTVEVARADADRRPDADRRAVAGVVPRPRLAAILDLRWPQLCVMRAASGSGKTTLLRGWALDRTDRSPLLWLTTSAGVPSSAAFWTRVIDAARRSGDVSANTSAALVEQVARSADPVGVAIDFLSGLGPVTFVLDAYEKVGGAIAEIDRDLLRLTAELPEVRVIVAARGGTGLAEDALLLRDRVRVIDDDDLAFTESDTAALLQVHLGRDDPALAASIVRATHGYALAVRAVVLGMSRRASIPTVDSAEWRQLVATDLRAALPDQAIARFVAATSVPPYLDADLAAAITGRSDVEQVLDLLEHHGFGRWIPYARQHPVFQYVDSIREAFVAEVRRGADATYERSAGLAARWLFASGDHEMAFDLALAARNYPLAVQVYVDLLRESPECYLTDRLIGPLSSLPVPVLRHHPMLAFALGLARLTHPVLRASAPEAFLLSVNNPSRTKIVAADLDGFINRSVRAVSLRLIRRYTDAARSSRAAIADLDRLSPDRRDQLAELVAMILRQLSYCLLLGGAYEEAVATMNRSAGLTKVSSGRNYALAYLVGTHGFTGDLPAARDARARVDPHGWPRDSESTYLNAMTRIGEGFLQLDALDFSAALDTIAGSPSFTGTTEFWPLFTLVATHARLGLGAGLSAARQVDPSLRAAIPPHGTGDNAVTRALWNLVAISWLAGGRVAKAERILAAGSPRAAELVPARVLHLILTERESSAVERLARWLALPRHTVRSRAATLALGAVAARRAADDRLAVSLAVRAYDLHRAQGVRAHLMFLPAADRQELARLAESAGHADTARHFRGCAGDVIPAVVPRIVLSDKELAVLAELTVDASRGRIAARLGVSPNTVKTQLRSIYQKLGVSSRDAAISAATEYELLEVPGPPADGDR
jgi:LuxR family maltose regulon positive regulatory protein